MLLTDHRPSGVVTIEMCVLIVVTITVTTGQVCNNVDAGRVDSVDYSACTIKDPGGFYTGNMVLFVTLYNVYTDW